MAPYARSSLSSASPAPTQSRAAYVRNSPKDDEEMKAAKLVLLSTKLSDYAPRKAQIVSRSLSTSSVLYTVKIGEIEIGNVGVDEVLDYVSALDLETFENEQFKEEAKVEDEVRVEKEKRKRERRERKAWERRLRIGLTEDVVGSKTGRVEEAVRSVKDGASGRRPRPVYEHLFKLGRRRRRKRDLETGELLPLSNDGGFHIEAQESDADSSSNEEDNPPTNTVPSSRGRSHPPDQHAPQELPKRRRRRRDKVSGELLPLPSDLPGRSFSPSGRVIRSRRRRHPETGELMPLGWKPAMAMPSASAMASAARSDASSSVSSLQPLPAGPKMLSLKRLSISGPPNAKRMKLTQQPSSSTALKNAVVMIQRSAERLQPTPRAAMPSVVDLDEAESDSASEIETSSDPIQRHAQSNTGRNTMLNPLPRQALQDSSVTPLMLTQRAGKTALKQQVTNPISSSEAPESESEARNAMISNLSATPYARLEREISTSASSTSSMIPLSANSPESNLNLAATQAADPSHDSRDEDIQEGEFEIEDILGHRPSDPRTHPPELGDKSIILYRVKWIGWDDPTWEPAESFGDPDVVLEYRRRAGLEICGGGVD